MVCAFAGRQPIAEFGGDRGGLSLVGGRKVPHLTVSMDNLSAGSSMPGLFWEWIVKGPL